MKAKIFSFLVISSIFILTGNAQNDTIRLIPEFGKEYIYDFTESTYVLVDNNEKQNHLVETRSYSTKFDTLVNANTGILKVKIIQNKIEKPDLKPAEFNDYRFPYLQEGFPDSESPEFTKALLSRFEFIYNFDFKTSKIELLNFEEIISKAKIILREKGFSAGKIDNRIKDFKDNSIPETTSQVQQIFQISGLSFSEENFNQEVFDVSIEMQRSKAQIHQKRWKKEAGLYSMDIVWEPEKRFLREFNTVVIDSLNYLFWVGDKSYRLNFLENDIRLRTVREISQNTFTISGKIESPKSKKVTLAVLRSPFGTDLSQETVFLDENNYFHIETELEHPQLVYLQFGNQNFVDTLPIMAFYAEPGSRIHLEAQGSTFPWEVSFSGSFAGASNLLYDLRKEYNIFNERLDWNTIYYSSSNDIYPDFERAIKEFKNFAQKYVNEIDKYTFEFIRNEIKAYLLTITIDYLQRLEISNRARVGRIIFPEKNEIDSLLLTRELNSTNLFDIYNEYGIHSRQLAELYLRYSFRNNQMVTSTSNTGITSSIITSSGYYLTANDLPNRMETAKNILAGHPLYSYLAGWLSNEKMSAVNQPSWFEEYKQSQIDNYLDLIIRVCNDNEFINAILKVVNNHKNWEDKNYVPVTKFFDEKGKTVYMEDFLGKKPTIFYITNEWSRERYLWDDLAKENPDLNFVLVMEGSNIQEWLDYEKRAEPLAHQLFLINGPKLRDIFKNSASHFIVYNKNGERFAFASNMVTAKNLATQALNGFKDRLDRSQLKIIIIVLSITLLAFIFGVLVWRWQIRQRLRKEEQQRRLRELELTAIRSQMNPHFLFNSLNSVQNLIQQNKGREAHLYLADFAGLIRKVLQNSEKEEVSLAEELEMTEQYLNLEKLRFEFDFNISVPDNVDTNNTLVPSLLLQPFTENAVIHGLQNKSGSRHLKIEVSREELGIKIVIEDSGIGREEAQKIAQTKNGKGSKLMKERLEILQEKQGEKYQLEIIDVKGEESGTRVEILIPDEK